jgi:hypothetical protein
MQGEGLYPDNFRPFAGWATLAAEFKICQQK